jgi:hypothetical protein
MPRCINLIHSTHHPSAWSRCPRPALPGKLFCRSHRNALDGAIMGLLYASHPRHVTQIETASGRIEESAAEFRDPAAIAFLGIPPGLAPARLRKKFDRARRLRRRRQRKRNGRQERAPQARTETPSQPHATHTPDTHAPIAAA